MGRVRHEADDKPSHNQHAAKNVEPPPLRCQVLHRVVHGSFLRDLLRCPPQKAADRACNEGNRQYGESCRKPDKADGIADSGSADCRADNGVFGCAAFFVTLFVHAFPLSEFWFLNWKHGGACSNEPAP